MRKNEPFTENAYGILKHMKGGQNSRGFTIVETLIVIAITGVLFAAIAMTLSGRQSKTEFTQAIQEIQSQIQQVISDTGTGYYPNGNNFQCVASLSGPQFSTLAANEQGTNEGCVFLGKAIQFGVSGSVGGIEKFNVFTIAGLQHKASGDEVQTLAEALPTPIATATSGVNGTDKKTLLYGLTIGKAYYGASNTPIGTVAFVNSLASYSSGSLISGSQQVQVIPVTGSGLNTTEDAAALNIKSQLATSPVDPAEGVTLCFVSGGTDQTGIIKIGGSARQLSVTLDIKGTKVCS
jgi:prepilin-type N-terminal cleavage/methylation domain-containing protein